MALSVTPRGNFVYTPDGVVLDEFFWDRHEFSCIQGPIGSGTSSASCHRIWTLACEQLPDFDNVRRTRWIITRDTYKELKETTVKTWLEWFPEEEWGQFIRAEPMFHHLKRDHPSGDGTIVDCEVIFLAIPDPDVAEAVLASYEITGFFRNEGQFCPKGVIDELLSRCSRYPSMKNGSGATWYGGWMDMNAPVEGHWVPYMRGDIPLPADMAESERRAFVKPDNWQFFIQPPGLIETVVDGEVRYQPNPKAENQRHLKQSYMDKIQGKAKSWIDRRVVNRIGLYRSGKAVYPTFVEGEHVHAYDVEPVQGLKIIVGLDFGREPAAIPCQEINGSWVALSEVIGSNTSAELFAPKVKKHLMQMYPGFEFEFSGDPRGADKGQNDESTAYGIFEKHGMRVVPATTDNNPELRRSTVEGILGRRNGLKVNPRCLMLKQGLAGGYNYPKIKGTALYRDKPVKNMYSHPVEAFENAVLGGGEGYAIVRGESQQRKTPSLPKKKRISLRRASR